MSLNQLFSQFVGSTQPQNSSQNGLSGLTNAIPGGLVGGLAAGGLLGVLVGNKKARKTVGKVATGAAGIGGAAILGAVAFNAYKKWQDGKSAPNTTAPTSQTPVLEANNFDPVTATAHDGQPFQVTLIKAMIAAANADGHIDAQEQAAVFEAVNEMQLEPADKALIFDTLQNPPDIQTIASMSNGLEQSSEIYLASRMAIDPDHPLEKRYLDDLAQQLALPADFVTHLEGQIAQQELQPQ